jgi:beta-glucanase (GH16 family)
MRKVFIIALCLWVLQCSGRENGDLDAVEDDGAAEAPDLAEAVDQSPEPDVDADAAYDPDPAEEAVDWTDDDGAADTVDDHYWPELPPAPEGKTWSLVLSDEFDGTEIDDSKWQILGDWERRDGWWMQENSSLDGEGHLVIRIDRDGERFTDGGVRTRDRFYHSFGYYEARCEFHEQPGHWPAFWIYDDSVGTVGNEGRDGTEIDIMEKAWLEERINHALHWDGYGEFHQSESTQVDLPGLNEGWHTFGLHWSETEYVFYVDGVETWRTSAGGVSQVPEYIKLTDEIGDWAGDIHDADLPDYFRVDYVRVYDAL